MSELQELLEAPADEGCWDAIQRKYRDRAVEGLER